jgi:hypothetical protein
MMMISIIIMMDMMTSIMMMMMIIMMMMKKKMMMMMMMLLLLLLQPMMIKKWHDLLCHSRISKAFQYGRRHSQWINFAQEVYHSIIYMYVLKNQHVRMKEPEVQT